MEDGALASQNDERKAMRLRERKQEAFKSRQSHKQWRGCQERSP